MRYLPEWWPGQHFKKVGALFREHNFEQLDRPLDFVKRQMVKLNPSPPSPFVMLMITKKTLQYAPIQAKGIEVPSFTSKMLRQRLNGYEEDVVKCGANALYGGGTDTVRPSACCTPPC